MGKGGAQHTQMEHPELEEPSMLSRIPTSGLTGLAGSNAENAEGLNWQSPVRGGQCGQRHFPETVSYWGWGLGWCARPGE